MLFRKRANMRKKIFQKCKKNRCTLAPFCYSLFMQDHFDTQIQSDEFASEWEQIKRSSEFVSEFEADLDEMEKKHWQEIENRGN